ncbi:hypothetical protein QQZ08_001197 [Neonectria magnoliae]|uniref:Prolyl 4-hydroxylase alpha subunit Fe(2+) 2OG dioxygenase domain-containing protein n=1 Tax=Neonectria magnoliae TaxID=2732573 RepID=A0ABR1IF28_9HYPO
MANYAPRAAARAFEMISRISAQGAVSDSSTRNHSFELKTNLLDALQGIQTSGSFASFRKLSQTPPAGLFVDGVGDITMPLGESQARQLIASASQAPFGKGSDTIVDTAVRNTWELDADKFTFKDPAWPHFIQKLCTDVAEDLGIEGTVRAEVYKMLVYEKGAMFKAHTDTEKIPGMFGSLVICLPSPHEGGEVVLKHCGEKKIFKTSEATQSIACWYSDVSHEVLPVTSGYRWVVTYNLAIDHVETRPSVSLQRSETKDLRDTLERWLAEDVKSREREFVYHVLDHDYTEANVSLKMLKAQDLTRVQALKDLSSELPFDIFLALLEKEEIGSVEFDYSESRRGRSRYYGGFVNEGDGQPFHDLEEVLDTTYSVKTLHDLEGHIVANRLKLDDNDLLEHDAFDDFEAEESYEGYMGNSGPTATHWYRVTAVVIVPHESIPTFFDSQDGYSRSRQNNFPLQVRYLTRRCLRPQVPESAFAALMKLCEKAWHSPPTTSMVPIYPEQAIDGEGMRDLLKIAVQRERYALFEKAAVKNKALLPLDFFVWLRQWLVSSGGNVSDRLNATQKGLTSLISAYSHFADQFQAIAAVAPTDQHDTFGPTLVWALATLRSCLASCAFKTLGKEDGTAMVDVALYLSDSFDLLSKT